MKRQCLLSVLLLLVLLDEVGFISIFMSYNHISDNTHGEAGRTLTRAAILLLRAAAPKLDQRTRQHTVSLGCAGRRGCRGGRTKAKHQHSFGIPVVVGRRPNRPNRHPATSTDNSRQRTLVAVTTHASLPPRFCQSNVNLDRCITGSPPQTGSAPPTLYVFNASSLSKPHAIEHLSAELIGYDIDAAVISETHLKKKHVDSCVNVSGYALFRRDRPNRKGGGVAIYVRQTFTASEWSPVAALDRQFELLWVKVGHGTDIAFIGALYHPPVPVYQTSDILDHIESAVLQIQQDFPVSHVILAGDFNKLPEYEVVTRTGLTPLVSQPTRGSSILDRVYVSGLQYGGIKVVKSAVKSDHHAVVAYTGDVKRSVSKSRRVCTYRKHTAAEHARFLASTPDATALEVNPDGHLQEEFDRTHNVMLQMLDDFYPARRITVTSTDPPYITANVKAMLRRKNRLMRSGRVEKAAALATKVGIAIRNYNTAELSRVDVLSDASSMWAKVRQLTGRSKGSDDYSSVVTAGELNDHYAAISTDPHYTAPPVKHTVNDRLTSAHITEWRMFSILDTLKPTATGLDGIPAWFLKTGAPFFAQPLADIMNLSVSSSVVPSQWKRSTIRPIAKVASPHFLSDYRPISVTPVMSRILERIVVRDFIYPALSTPPTSLSFSDQFAFQPLASTTAALIHLLQSITSLLLTNEFVIVYALDFSKAFDSVRHSTVLSKMSLLDLPDNIYNWIESFFSRHSHCTKFGNDISHFSDISASIVQGSGIGPVSYVVTASDLHPVSSGNLMTKYADDTYLIIPASNANTCHSEIEHIESWSTVNNLQLNRAKSSEIVFVRPKNNRNLTIPPPAVSGFRREEKMKALGVTFSRKFSVSSHVDELLTKCSQSLFALRTLRHHGLPQEAIQAVFQAVVVNKLTYATPAWYGFTNAADRGRLDSFLRRSAKLGYRDANSPSFDSMCDNADERLFSKIVNNSHHPLYSLLPPQREQHYELRERTHNFQLPHRSSSLTDSNFFMRMLFKNTGCVP